MPMCGSPFSANILVHILSRSISMNFLQKALFGVNKLMSPFVYRITSSGRQIDSLKQILHFPARDLSTNNTSSRLFLPYSSTFRQCPLFLGKSRILSKIPSIVSSLPQNEGINQQVRTYKVKLNPKPRCKGCYFIRRNGRLFVECNLKPRHKQMEFQTKDKLWKEDYSKGNVKAAAFWKWSKEIWYHRGNTKWARYDWLQGKYDS